MIRIKICGITSITDALAAVQAGADAIGLVFHPPSPRYVSEELAQAIVGALPPFISIVGLFVNTPRQEILRLANLCALDHIQLHGDETPAECQGLHRRVLKAIRVSQAEDLMGLERFPVAALLLDAKVPGLYGGSGQSFDWSILSQARLCRPIILAGGLTPDNVTHAITLVHPYAVDVSSGVESAPGVKDPAKMRAFVEAIRG